MKAECIVIYITAPSDEVGQALSKGLVEHRLAACVNIVPSIRSLYRWEGEIQSDQEVLLIVKTQRSLFDNVKTYITEHHPYDVPEVIGLPIQAGSEKYISWIVSETKSG